MSSVSAVCRFSKSRMHFQRDRRRTLIDVVRQRQPRLDPCPTPPHPTPAIGESTTEMDWWAESDDVATMKSVPLEAARRPKELQRLPHRHHHSARVNTESQSPSPLYPVISGSAYIRSASDCSLDPGSPAPCLSLTR